MNRQTKAAAKRVRRGVRNWWLVTRGGLLATTSRPSDRLMAAADALARLHGEW